MQNALAHLAFQSTNGNEIYFDSCDIPQLTLKRDELGKSRHFIKLYKHIKVAALMLLASHVGAEKPDITNAVLFAELGKRSRSICLISSKAGLERDFAGFGIARGFLLCIETYVCLLE